MRERARERRDKSLGQIRDEYADTLNAIAALEQQLLGRAIPDKTALSAAVDHAIPRGEQFTVAMIMSALEASDPGRVWPIASVRRHVTSLRENGIVRRVRRHAANQPGIYIWDDGAMPATPNDRTLKQIVQEVATSGMPSTQTAS